MEEEADDPNYASPSDGGDIQQLPQEVVIILNQGPFDDNDQSTQELTVARYLAVAGENGPTFELIPDSARQAAESSLPPPSSTIAAAMSLPPSEEPKPAEEERGSIPAQSATKPSWESKGNDLDQVSVEFVKETPSSPSSSPEKAKPETSRSLRKNRRAAASSSYSHPSSKKMSFKKIKTEPQPIPSRKLKFPEKIRLIKQLRAEGELVCPIANCGMHFDKFRLFKHHYKRCTSDQKKPCPYCEQMMEPTKLSAHVQELHQKKKASEEKKKEESYGPFLKRGRGRPPGKRDSRSRPKKDARKELQKKKKSKCKISPANNLPPKLEEPSSEQDITFPTLVEEEEDLLECGRIPGDAPRDEDGITLEDLVFNHSSKKSKPAESPFRTKVKPHILSKATHVSYPYPIPASRPKGIQRVLQNIKTRDHLGERPLSSYDQPSTSHSQPATSSQRLSLISRPLAQLASKSISSPQQTAQSNLAQPALSASKLSALPQPSASSSAATKSTSSSQQASSLQSSVLSQEQTSTKQTTSALSSTHPLPSSPHPSLSSTHPSPSSSHPSPSSTHPSPSSTHPSPSSPNQSPSSPNQSPSSTLTSKSLPQKTSETSSQEMDLPSLLTGPAKKKVEPDSVSLSRDWGSDRKTYKKVLPHEPETSRSSLKTTSSEPRPKLSVRFQNDPIIFPIEDPEASTCSIAKVPEQLELPPPPNPTDQSISEAIQEKPLEPSPILPTPTTSVSKENILDGFSSELQIAEPVKGNAEDFPLEKSTSPTLITLRPMVPISYIDPGSENDSNSQNIAPEIQPPPVQERPKPTACKPIPKVSRNLVKKITSKVVHDIYQLPPISANKEQISLKSFMEAPKYDNIVFSSLTNIRGKPFRKYGYEGEDKPPTLIKNESLLPSPAVKKIALEEEVGNDFDEESENVDNPPPSLFTSSTPEELEEAKKKLYSAFRWSKGKNRVKFINAIKQYEHVKKCSNPEQLLHSIMPTKPQNSDQSLRGGLGDSGNDLSNAISELPATSTLAKADTSQAGKRSMADSSAPPNNGDDGGGPPLPKKPSLTSMMQPSIIRNAIGNPSGDANASASPKLPKATLVKFPLQVLGSSGIPPHIPKKRGRKRKNPLPTTTPENKPIVVTEQDQIPQILKMIQPYINQLNSQSTKVLIINSATLNSATAAQKTPGTVNLAAKCSPPPSTSQTSPKAAAKKKSSQPLQPPAIPSTSSGTKPKRRGRQKLVPDSSDEETPEGPYTCSACKLEVEDYQDARNHIWKTHYGLARLNNEVPWKENESIARLRKALKKNKVLPCMVPGCTRVFQNEIGYFYHFKTCGNENPYVECEYCGKKLKSFSLRPHIMNFHPSAAAGKKKEEESDLSSEEEEKTLPDPSPRGSRLRQAAYRARQNVRKFIRRQKGLKDEDDQADGEENSDQNKKEDTDHSMEFDSEDAKTDEEAPDAENKPPQPCRLNYSYRKQLQAWSGHFKIPGNLVSPEMEESWNTQLMECSFMACKTKGCQFKTELIQDMKEHLVACAKKDDIWKCLICNAKFDHSRYLFFHLKAHHSDKINKDDMIVKRNNLKPLTEAMEWTLKFLMNNDGSPTFPKWKPNLEKWKHQFLGWEKYLPPLATSPHFKTSSGTSPWKQLECFESESFEKSNSHFSLFVGGPVWAMAWCPTLPGVFEKQYLALATGATPGDLHPLMPPSRGPGLVQIWEMGYLTFLRASAKPRLCLALAHDEGPAWELAWGPAECWEEPSTEGATRRLGLLAAAFNSGNILLYSIPHPPSHHQPGQSPVYWAQPLVTLSGPGRGGPCHLAQPAPCCTLDWHEDKLVAGYSTGLVCVWTLPATSATLHLTFPAHQSAVTAARWCPRFHNGRFLATCGLDRTVRVWDLDHPSVPIMCHRSGLLRDIRWGLHWCGVVAAQDDAFTYSNHTFFRESGYYHFGTQLAHHNSTIWSVSLSDWLNAQASCDHAGELVVAIMPDLSKPVEAKGFAKNRIPLYRVEMEALTEDKEDSEAGVLVDSLVAEVSSNMFDTSMSQLQHKLEAQLAALPTSDDSLTPRVTRLRQCLKEIRRPDLLVEELERLLPSFQSGSNGAESCAADLVACLQDSISALKNLVGVRPTYKETVDKFGLVFHDHNLKSINKIPRSEYARLHKSDRMNSPDLTKFPLCSLTSVSWNPNLGSHLWVASGSQSGLVRLSLAAGLYQPSMETMVKRAHTWHSTCT